MQHDMRRMMYDVIMQVMLGSGVHIGQDIMTEDAVADAQRLREDQYRAHQVCESVCSCVRLWSCVSIVSVHVHSCGYVLGLLV